MRAGSAPRLPLAHRAHRAGAASASWQACFVKLCYGSWTWDLCLLLGTITSATDPVAVVAMLRELGAKVSLSTTIEGESLLNDGSAVVLFVVLKGIAEVRAERPQWWRRQWWRRQWGRW